jgi:hypothetical protein
LAGDLRGVVRDAESQSVLAARVYIQRLDDGSWHFVGRTESPDQALVPYSKQNWIRAESQEHHTAVPAAAWSATLQPGTYRVTVERGQEYFPAVHELVMEAADQSLEIRLRRWCDMSQLGHFSGDLHVHRPIDELPVAMSADDVNVTLPLTSWVQSSQLSPAAVLAANPAEAPEVKKPQPWVIDPHHVVWPINTEYEIFEVGQQRHTLGALFVLGHPQVFERQAPPWEPVIEEARRSGSGFDFDKLDWPFAMLLPVLAPEGICELANNHVWRTEFAFREWNSFAPAYMQPPRGGRTGDERQWVNYTLGMYYTLLNAGFRLPIGAGTATGVHPVPLGFSRVYVQLDAPFSFEKWFEGLQRGRSFMTTGPKLIAKLDGQWPGHVFPNHAAEQTLILTGQVLSEQPLTLLEVIINGVPHATLPTAHRKLECGACETRFEFPLTVPESSWVCVRAFEDREGRRFRFAHTNPWHVEIPGRPLLPRNEEREYLVTRMQVELGRSGPILDPTSRGEYERALQHYQALEVAPLDRSNARPAADSATRQDWIENMRAHHFTRDEMLAALAIEPAELDRLMRVDRQSTSSENTDSSQSTDSPKLRVLPYPGGRHPRIGFLDGAIRPQRETKLSVFTPWDPASYVVVDLPEAVFTDLGLTYLAHTHVPTIWNQQGIELPALEWTKTAEGGWRLERGLPNGIVLTSEARPVNQQLHMQLTLRNGTSQPLHENRAQVCVMLRGAEGFTAQTNQNKRIDGPFVACHDGMGQRWVITAWQPLHRAWANPPCPCLHADPLLPACGPGETVTARGWLTFYEGTEIEAELERLRQTWNLSR